MQFSKYYSNLKVSYFCFIAFWHIKDIQFDLIARKKNLEYTVRVLANKSIGLLNEEKQITQKIIWGNNTIVAPFLSKAFSLNFNDFLKLYPSQTKTIHVWYKFQNCIDVILFLLTTFGVCFNWLPEWLKHNVAERSRFNTFFIDTVKILKLCRYTNQSLMQWLLPLRGFIDIFIEIDSNEVYNT